MNTLQRLLLLPPELCLDTWQLDEAATRLCLTIVSRQAQSNCPLCTAPSTRVHSHYERTLADLPCGGCAVTWKLRVRKFFCGQPECIRRIFTERLAEVVAPWARRTLRLAAHLTAIALAIGGIAGARLAVQLGLVFSHDTLLRAVHRLELPEPPTPTVLGIDDWAHRKGCTYGTILVNLETRKPVALLADREVETVVEWLKAHPGVQVITRDRSLAYRKAGQEGAPEAVQVADRFHLLKNLAEALQRDLEVHLGTMEMPVSARAVLTVASIPPPEREPDDVERVAAVRARRLAAYEDVHRLKELGCTLKAIAAQLQLGVNTVKRYLASPSFPERGDNRNRGKSRSGLEEHKAYLLERWNAGHHHGKQLWEEVKAQGCRAGYGTVSRFLRCLKEVSAAAMDGSGPEVQSDLPRMNARSTTWAAMLPSHRKSEEDLRLLKGLREVCPVAACVVELAEDFAALVRSRSIQDLDGWLARVESSGFVALERFARGLRDDYAAVRSGVSLPWSNGQVEGQVNRLKMLKRQMFGRAGMDLLSRRFLLSAG